MNNPVCFCFEYSEEGIVKDVVANDGTSIIM